MKKSIRNAFLLGLCLPALGATGFPQKWKSEKRYRKPPLPLRFREDGTFRILHLTDIHLVDPEMDDDENRAVPLSREKETLHAIEACLQEAKPDLVVLGGDNLSGYWEEFTYDYIEKAIGKILSPIRERGIPLALVFGNHDGEAGFHTEIQMLLYMEYENCRSCLNEADVFGCGNCHLPILSFDGTHPAYNIWLMDSNDYMKKPDGSFGYAYVHADQLEWYEKTAALLREENGGKTVPAVLFQHMPVQQELDLLEECPAQTENAVERGGKFYSFGDKLLSGRLRECPCPPAIEYDHREQLRSWVKTGDVRAAFFGHDHVNDFRVCCEGIDLYQTLGCGYFTYGKEHGGRLIILHEDDKAPLETATIEVPRITNTAL